MASLVHRFQRRAPCEPQSGRGASLRLPCSPLLTRPGNRIASSRPLLLAGDPPTRIKDITELTLQTKKLRHVNTEYLKSERKERSGNGNGTHSWQRCEQGKRGQGAFHAKFYFDPDSSVGKESATMQETLVRFLGREDPLEKGKATHSSILAWRIPWTV